MNAVARAIKRATALPGSGTRWLSRELSDCRQTAFPAHDPVAAFTMPTNAENRSAGWVIRRAVSKARRRSPDLA